tara:strand:- start:21 stop:203 length:183 start_codon:yes stop_codon:yes gene_type:complete
MSKNNEKENIHLVGGDNIIKFPKPPPPSRSRGEENVEIGSRFTIHFEPDWDTDEEDSTDS